MGISRDEWLAAVAEAGLNGESDDDAITVNEFAEMFQIPRTTAAGHLKKLVERGCARRAQKRGISDGGKTIMFAAYRLTTTPQKKKR